MPTQWGNCGAGWILPQGKIDLDAGPLRFPDSPFSISSPCGLLLQRNPVLLVAFVQSLIFLPSESNCTTHGTYWNLIETVKPTRRLPHLRSWVSTCSVCLPLGRAGQRHPERLLTRLTQDAVQNLLEEVARWPSEGSDAGLNNLNFFCGLWGPIEGF